MSDLRYMWADGPGSVGVSDEVSLPQFKVHGYRQRANEISLSSGNYSRLACDIQFVRSMGYYLIQIYIPSSKYSNFKTFSKNLNFALNVILFKLNRPNRSYKLG